MYTCTWSLKSDNVAAQNDVHKRDRNAPDYSTMLIFMDSRGNSRQFAAKYFKKTTVSSSTILTRKKLAELIPLSRTSVAYINKHYSVWSYPG